MEWLYMCDLDHFRSEVRSDYVVLVGGRVRYPSNSFFPRGSP